MTEFRVAAFYKFARLPDFEALQAPLRAAGAAADVKGTILLAEEGVNGAIAGPSHGVEAVLARLRADPRLSDLTHKDSFAREQPFLRLKVRLKKEIVTMGVDAIDPVGDVGTYVAPEDWNALIARDDVVVIDTRNDYEVEIGAFKGAIDPKTTSFREFPAWARENAAALKGKKIAMYCTGGIRCEKATAFMRAEGYDEVYHLKGGILKYLEHIPEAKSRWDGECFVFDGRVSVRHGLEEGDYDQCYGCRRPLSAEDKASPLYMRGVACPKCHDTLSPDQKARFAERQRQIDLARKRGEAHLARTPAMAPADEDA